MLRLFITITSLISCLQVLAQPTVMSYRIKLISADEKIASSQVSVLIKGEPFQIREEVQNLGGRVKFSSGRIVSAVLRADALSTLAEKTCVERIEEGKIDLRPLNDRMLVNNRIDLVHSGVSPLPQGYEGMDVVVGIIDTGIDFTHPDFRDSLGNSRILWIWDHLLDDSTNTPQPFGYGQEFSKNDIDSGRASAHVDQTAHGTHVAGIAAANGDSLQAFRGAAPQADIMAVSLDFSIDDESWLSSIADAVAYIFQKADSIGKPCVINISAGTYLGSHDGKDLQAQAIDNLIKSQHGRMVVAAAGNAGNLRIHLRHQPSGDTLFTWFKQSTAAPLYIECWADTADLNQVAFSIGADAVNSSFSFRGQVAWTGILMHLNQLKKDTLYSLNGNRLAIIESYGQLIGDRYSLIFSITPDSSTYNFRLMSTGNGKFDLWSFEMVSGGLPTPSVFPDISRYVLPDLDQNICSSFQCSDVVVCVGQYVNRNNYIDVNGNLQTFNTTEGALAASSSRGPTRDGRIKPDITSTGEITLASLKLSSAPWFIANQPYKVAQGGLHIRDGGTSSAAPAVAGAIALLMQAQPTISWSDIRNSILSCPKLDNFTGNMLPDNRWGHGKFDAFTLMQGCSTASLHEEGPAQISIFPNPATDEITIRLSDKKSAFYLELAEPTGRTIRKIRNDGQDIDIKIPVTGISSGLYIIKAFDRKGGISTGRIVVQ